MKKLFKVMTGAAAVGVAALAAASPAQAQYYDRGYYDRDDDIDLGDVAAGVAILGGVALAIDALDGNDGY